MFVLSLAVRFWAASSVTFPIPPDAAYYYSVAENLHSGRGFVIDYTWNYIRGMPQSLPVPSNDYWQPLTSIILGLSFKIFPPSWQAAQLLTTLFGSLLPVLGFWFAFYLVKDLTLASLGGLFLALQPEMIFESATCDSPVFFSFFGAAGLISLLLGLTKSARWLVLVGMLSALSYLTRSDGAVVLLVATVVCLWFWKRDEFRVRGWLLCMWGVFAVIVAPWLLRNYLAFGSPFPTGQLKTIFAAKYEYLFSTQPEALTLSNYLSHGFGDLLAGKAKALVYCLRDLSAACTWPIVVLAVWEFVSARRLKTHLPIFFHFILIVLAAPLIFTLPALTYVHMVPPLVPLLPAFAILGFKRLWQKLHLTNRFHFGWGAAVLLLGLTAHSGLSLSNAAYYFLTQSETEAQLQRNIGAYLEGEGNSSRPIFTDEPWGYYYMNHKPAFFCPLDPYPRIKEAAAERNVEYVVLLNRVLAPLPDFKQAVEEDPYLVLVAYIFPFEELPNTDVAATFSPEDWVKVLPTIWAIPSWKVGKVRVFRFLDPNVTGKNLSLHDLGRLHNKSGQRLALTSRVTDSPALLEAALTCFRKAVKCAPDVPATYYNLALALHDLSRNKESNLGIRPSEIPEYQEALENARKALEMAPERADFAQLVNKLEAALGNQAH